MNNPFLNSPRVIVKSALKTVEPNLYQHQDLLEYLSQHEKLLNHLSFSTILLYGSLNSPLAPLPSIASTITGQSLTSLYL